MQLLKDLNPSLTAQASLWADRHHLQRYLPRNFLRCYLKLFRANSTRARVWPLKILEPYWIMQGP